MKNMNTSRCCLPKTRWWRSTTVPATPSAGRWRSGGRRLRTAPARQGRAGHLPAGGRRQLSDRRHRNLSGIRRRNHRATSPKSCSLTKLSAMSALPPTSFQPGDALYYVRRVGIWTANRSSSIPTFFLKSLVPGLTEAIAEKSIYEYIENDLQMAIVTSRRL